jgi:glycogen debranching enzyme
MLVTDQDGDVGREQLSGFFFRETRYLSRLAFELSGHTPHLCSIHANDRREICIVAVHPELNQFGGGGTGESGQQPTPTILGLPARALELRTRLVVRPASLALTTEIVNRARVTVNLRAAWSLAADFADLSEAMGGHAPARARAQFHEGCLTFFDTRVPVETRILASPGAFEWADGRLATSLNIGPRESHELTLEVRAFDAEDALSADDEEARLRACADWSDTVTRVFVPADGTIARAAMSAIADIGSLALLDGAPDEWLAPAAGIPLYPALFARDALTAGWQSLIFDRGELLDAALTKVGRLQGQQDDPTRDEQPGRIIQQVRRGPLARLGETPFARYYGDFASPFDFVMYLGQAIAWSGDHAQLNRHWDTARRIMDWARAYADPDGDGFLEYFTRAPAGPVHQGWKDSGRAIVDEHGNDVKPPLAVAEVQGYYFAAQQTMAVLSLLQGDTHGARDWWKSALQLKERFNGAFWLEEEGFPALALDSQKRIVPSIASNAGQCLATGIIADDNVQRMVRRLFQPDMFSGWGIRTLSSAHPAYDPLSYHLGSVWPVENGTIVFGLRRYGLDDRALELASALYDLSNLFEGFRVPECVGGYAREEFPNPGAYPQANAPQAWNQSVAGIVLQSMLGMFPLATAHVLLLDPVLPAWLPVLELRGLRVGSARVTIRFERNGSGQTDYDVLG